MTDRREFVHQASGLVAAIPMAGARPFAGQPPNLAIPSAAQIAWQDLEIGMFVHLAPNTWQDQEYDDRSTPLDRIMPDIDTDQWADAAVALGARYIVMVAKHVGGFCMWQTKTNSYGIAGTPWKGGRGDVMSDLSRSCATRGLKLGVYLSPRDDSLGAGQSGRCATPELQSRYDRICRQQLTELLTHYGPIAEIWFDGSSVVPVGDILARHARNSMIFQGPHATIRWVGNEDGFSPYPAWNSLAKTDAKTGIATALHGDPSGDTWLPNEVDVSIRRPDWFWHTTNEKNLLTTDQLIEIYYRSVGRGGQLLLNLPPDRTGRIPSADMARVKEFGEEIRRRFGVSVGSVRGSGAEVVLSLPKEQRIDHLVLAEDLRGGERVRGYRIEAAVGGEWVLLATGSAIGHKRIQPIVPTYAQRLRLRISQSAGVPMIRTFAAFATGAEPPQSWSEPAPAWADDDAGIWENGEFDLDLSPKIKAPATYQLRFVGQGGPAELAGLELTVGGVPAPQLVRIVPKRPELRLITISDVGRPIRIRGQISGVLRGNVLVRRTGAPVDR